MCHKERELASLARESDWERFKKQFQIDLAQKAEYEVLPFTVFACPDCKKESKVPENVGHIRIKCPHCGCQFVRKA